MNAIYDQPAGFSSIDVSSVLTKCAVFLLGAVAGIAGFVGVLSIGEAEAERSGGYTAAPALLMPDAGNVSTSSPGYSSTLIPAGSGETNSFFNDYRLERDACCPAE